MLITSQFAVATSLFNLHSVINNFLLIRLKYRRSKHFESHCLFFKVVRDKNIYNFFSTTYSGSCRFVLLELIEQISTWMPCLRNFFWITTVSVPSFDSSQNYDVYLLLLRKLECEKISLSLFVNALRSSTVSVKIW